MVITKKSKLDKKILKLKTVFCKRCGNKLTGSARIKGFSVICPRCRRPI